MNWRERKWLLLSLGLFLLVNLLFFFTYRLRFEERLKEMDERVATAKQGLAAAKSQHATARRDRATYDQVQKDLQHVYTQIWSTPEERMTSLISEIYRLAQMSQLQPVGGYKYDPGEGKRGREEIGTETFEIAYGVVGRYDQIRRLVNLIELSNQFIIIDSITLQNGDTSSALQMNLTLKTLFKTTNVSETSEL